MHNPATGTGYTASVPASLTGPGVSTPGLPGAAVPSSWTVRACTVRGIQRDAVRQ